MRKVSDKICGEKKTKISVKIVLLTRQVTEHGANKAICKEND
jgi:hypothetical protein